MTRGVPQYQHGTALVVALVLLAAITLLSVAAVQTSVLEMRMASNDESRMKLFQGAESAIDMTIRNFKVHQERIGNAQSTCVHGCDGETAFADSPLYGDQDALTVRLSKLGECLPPPRVRAASSVTEFTRFDYIIDSELARTDAAGGRTRLWRGYMQLSPSGGC